MFDIPVALILFRRTDTLPRIIGRLREVQPSKVYLLADCGRNETERKETDFCRAEAERLIDWDCTVVKYYAEQNRGVYENIGGGAKWVFEREETAIFIEDDNLPEVTFFRYAKELLEKYKDDPRVAWICGTNYFTEMKSDVSYKFTKHLLPCGWASWSSKFADIYDGELENMKKPSYVFNFFKNQHPKLLGFYRFQCLKNEKFHRKVTGKFISWDYQMVWSVRSRDMYGIIPMCNQITNIGVDDISEHGGTTKQNVMTDRFCEIPSKPLTFPLKHPEKVALDKDCEKSIGNIICPPPKSTVKLIISSKLKHLMGYDAFLPWGQILKKK